MPAPAPLWNPRVPCPPVTFHMLDDAPRDTTTMQLNHTTNTARSHCTPSHTTLIQLTRPSRCSLRRGCRGRCGRHAACRTAHRPPYATASQARGQAWVASGAAASCAWHPWRVRVRVRAAADPRFRRGVEGQCSAGGSPALAKRLGLTRLLALGCREVVAQARLLAHPCNSTRSMGMGRVWWMS